MNKKMFLALVITMFTILLVSCDLFETSDPFKAIFEEVTIIYQENDNEGAIRYDLVLPDYSDLEADAVFVWSSSHPNVISNAGLVTRPERSTWVVLTLSVRFDGQLKTKQYPVYVLSINDDAINETTYEVTFNFNNGSSSVVVEVIENGLVSRPADPVKSDYTFQYWLLDQDIFDFNTPINGDISLDAYYELESETGRKLTFYDEFYGSTLDTNKWEYQEGTGSEYGIWAWGNSEKQYYTRDNIEVLDGILNIHARQETGRADSHFTYTSGKIVSYETHNGFRDNEDGFRQTYGRFEARMKAPLGDGFWPAFWLMPAQSTYGNGWPYNGEIDIVELRGRRPFEVSSAVHFSNVGPYFGSWNGGHHSYLHQNYSLPSGVSIDQFNVYAVEWQPGKIEFLVNDVVYHTRVTGDFPNYEGFGPFNQPFYIIINLAVGGHFDNYREPSDSDFPAKLEIDWVRVYESL